MVQQELELLDLLLLELLSKMENENKTQENSEEKNQKIVESNQDKKESLEQKTEKQIEEKKEPGKKEIKKETKIIHFKKNEAIARGFDLQISTKDSIALCRFIKGKKIDEAVKDLELVLKKKKAVPMKGEIPHRRGKIMGGRYPVNAIKVFIKLIKTLEANSRQNGLPENSKIIFANANIASMPYGRFGRYRKKRTHVVLMTKINKNIGMKK